METFKHVVILIVVGGGGIVALSMCLFVLYFVTQRIWPIFLGAGGGYLLWHHVDAGVGVAFGVLLCLVQFWWWFYTREELPQPMETNTHADYTATGYIHEYYKR